MKKLIVIGFAALAMTAAASFAEAPAPAALAVLGAYLGGVLIARSLRPRAAHQRRAAILDERRRCARDLHDGLAQELAYIKMQSARMAAAEPGGQAGQLALASERALDELRTAIADLRHQRAEPFSEEVSHVSRQLATRAGARVRLDLDATLEVDPERRDPLLRLLREAVTNGVNHGQATDVWIELSDDEGLRLAVRDNGVGFAPEEATSKPDSFGLVGMRERVRALGGDLRVRSRPGAGTEVEALLP